MANADLIQKQRKLAAGMSATTRLVESIVERQAELKKRLEALARLHKFASLSEQTRKIEDFMKRATVQEKQVGAMRKSHAVIDQKVQAIVDHDKKDIVAFERLLDRANDAMERHGKNVLEHQTTLDQLIAEADALLAAS